MVETIPSVRNHENWHVETGEPRYSNPKEMIKYIENICVFFFLLELIGRFWSCPLRQGFFNDKLNMVDVVAILPNVIEMIMDVIVLIGIIPKKHLEIKPIPENIWGITSQQMNETKYLYNCKVDSIKESHY